MRPAVELDPRQIIRVLTGGSATMATVVVDEAKLESAACQRPGRSVRPEAEERGLAYDGTKVDQTEARPGVTVEQSAASAIEDGFLVATALIEVLAEVVEPGDHRRRGRPGPGERRRARGVGADQGQGGPGRDLTISPIMIAKSLTFAAENSTLVPVLTPPASCAATPRQP